MITYQKYVLLLVALSATCLLPQLALAIGISPGDILLDNLSKNSQVESQIYIARSDASKEEQAQVTITGDAAQYISVPGGNIVTLPINQLNTKVPLLIQPGNLAAGTYSATINVSPIVTTKNNSTNNLDTVTIGSSVLAGAQAIINFTVTTQAIESFTIQSIEMADSEANQPIGFSYLMNNTGNVDTRPSKIEITLTDELDKTNTYSETLSAQQLPIIPAFTTQRSDATTQANLTPGLYSVIIKFYGAAGQVVYTSASLRLQIFSAGTLAQKGELADFTTDKTNYKPGEISAFSAHFKNTGTIGLNAALVIELFKDDVRVDVIKQEPLFIPVNQSTEFTDTFKPETGGNYKAVAYVNYGIFTTEKKEVHFSVESLSAITIAIFLGVTTLTIAVVLRWFLQRHKKSITPA